jgi:competence protein ComGC/general secretion pathway protein G
MQKRSKGFTVIEIVIVIVVVAGLVAVAVPNYLAAKAAAQKNACILNLKNIIEAKKAWALTYSEPPNATPTDSDLVGNASNAVTGVSSGFLKYFPDCPAGGKYTVGDLNTLPKCSIESHKLPKTP